MIKNTKKIKMSDEEVDDFEEVFFLCQINKTVKVVTHVVYHIVTRTHTTLLRLKILHEKNVLNFDCFY